MQNTASPDLKNWVYYEECEPEEFGYAYVKAGDIYGDFNRPPEGIWGKWKEMIWLTPDKEGFHRFITQGLRSKIRFPIPPLSPEELRVFGLPSSPEFKMSATRLADWFQVDKTGKWQETKDASLYRVVSSLHDACLIGSVVETALGVRDVPCDKITAISRWRIELPEDLYGDSLLRVSTEAYTLHLWPPKFVCLPYVLEVSVEAGSACDFLKNSNLFRPRPYLLNGVLFGRECMSEEGSLEDPFEIFSKDTERLAP